jgi:DNA-binding transcriptional LysR family regulator
VGWLVHCIQCIIEPFARPKGSDLIELRHLQSFLALAEEGHVGRAAARLGIEQSPLSRRLQALEQSVGAKLFERTPRGITLTPAGREFRAGVLPLLRQLEDSKQRALAASRGESGRLAVGCVVAAAYDGFLPDSLRGFAKDRPEVTISVAVMGTTESFGALRDGVIDVALTHSPPPPAEGFKHLVLTEDPFAVALPTNVAAAKGRGPVKLSDLAEMTWIMVPRSASVAFYDSFVAACEAAGFMPKIRYETTSASVALSLVSAGLGAVAKSSRQSRMSPAGVVFRDLCDYGRAAETFVVWRPDPLPSAALTALIASFVASAKCFDRRGAASESRKTKGPLGHIRRPPSRRSKRH